MERPGSTCGKADGEAVNSCFPVARARGAYALTVVAGEVRIVSIITRDY